MISPTTELAIITGALKLLSPGSERWTKGAFAEDDLGAPVQHYSPNAICFCLEGALRRACCPNTYGPIGPALYVIQHFGAQLGMPLCTWNDCSERTYTDVITLLQTRADQLRGEIKREGGVA